MKELQLTILTAKDLEIRYDKLKDTKMAHLTDEAIAQGYSIGVLHYIGLSRDSASKWFRYAQNVIAMKFKGQSYKLGIFTDLSEVDDDKLYFSFKTQKCVQLAHSLSGCDSDGFVYNC